MCGSIFAAGRRHNRELELALGTAERVVLHAEERARLALRELQMLLQSKAQGAGGS